MDTKKNNHANEYVQVMVKINIHKNDNIIKLQDCTKLMTIELCKLIYWTNKKIEKISFLKISKDFIKNNFEWVISIYLFI